MKKNPLEELINRILWNNEDAIITYIDRKNGIHFKEISGKDIEKAGTEFFFLKDGTMIPYHRIKNIKISGKDIYKKR
ncbi:MAG: DUF504 domain-containing protein [Thermoplasmata archaeon]|nr:DUF504 domain-containing protein [Thermoplasmata archaeon]